MTKFIETISGWINAATVHRIAFSDSNDLYHFYGPEENLLGSTYRWQFNPRDFGTEMVLPAAAGHVAMIVGAFTDGGKAYSREEPVVGWRVTDSENDDFLIGVPVLLDGPSDGDTVFIKTPDGWWYAVHDQSRFESRDEAIEFGRQASIAHDVRRAEQVEARAAKLVAKRG